MFSRKSPQQFYEEGRNFLDNGKYDEAIKTFTKVLELIPTSYESYAARGLAYAQKAFSDFKAGNEEQSENIDKNFLESIENFDVAIKILSRVITSESEKELLSDVYAYRAQSNFYLRNINESISDFNNSLKYNNNNTEILIRRGMLYLDILDDPELALEDFSKAIRIQPNAKAYVCRCWAHIDNENVDAAVKDYKRAKTLDTTYVKNSERTKSIFKLHQWEEFKEEADNLMY